MPSMSFSFASLSLLQTFWYRFHRANCPLAMCIRAYTCMIIKIIKKKITATNGGLMRLLACTWRWWMISSRLTHVNFLQKFFEVAFSLGARSEYHF